jgi:exodeoxyribonuclease VII large subunit
MTDTPEPSAPSGIWQISEITESIKHVLEDNFSALWVEGEISNFSRPASGHCYFTLKDDDARLSCVLWRWMAEELFFTPEDGMQVRAHGDISVYPPRGQYQLQVRTMRPVGEGELHKAFEALKKKLKNEGLFDDRHKRSLPAFPRRIGIITSGTGAAVQDMLSTLERRFPLVEVQLLPVQVQGARAAPEIVRAIETFNNRRAAAPVDLLIIGRGGGSLEDLWAFNEESVARAVFASEIPVISAVGHETDFSITDFVADERAATPTMAGELAVPDRRDLTNTIRARYSHLRERMQRVIRVREHKVELLTRSHRFRWPVDRLRNTIQRCDELGSRLTRVMNRYLEHKRSEIELLENRLESRDPYRPLQRGYAWVMKDDRPITAAGQLSAGDMVTLQFRDGRRTAQIDPTDAPEETQRA